MTLESRILEFIDELGPDIAAALDGILPSTVTVTAPATHKLTAITIESDNSSESGWVNRWEWLYKPFGGSATLVNWINKYGELRLTSALSNSVALRIFGKPSSGASAHTGNIFEILDDPTSLGIKLGVDADGNVVVAGTMTVTGAITREVASGPTLNVGYLLLATGASVPANTPANTVIVRY